MLLASRFRAVALMWAFALMLLASARAAPLMARVQAGDDAAWATRDWDDRAWTLAPAETARANAASGQTVWLRLQHEIAAGEGTEPRRLFVGLSGATDVFWDGRLLQSTERVTDERVWTHRAFALQAGETQPGRHVLAVRFRAGEGAGVRYFALSEGAGDIVVPQRWRVRAGDSPAWSAAEIDESSWTVPAAEGSFFAPGDFADVPHGVFWLRTGFIVPDAPPPQTAKLLFAIILGATEVYWDGRLIARNGVPGHTRAAEQPGLKFCWVPVPDALAGPGYHQLAIRVSSNYPKPHYQPLVTALATANSPRHIEDLVGLVWSESFALGFVSITGVLYLLLFAFAGRNLPHLLFGLTCVGFSSATMLEMAVLHRMFSYTYDMDLPVIRSAVGLTILTALLFPAFLLAQFRVARAWLWLAAAVIIYGATAMAGLHLMSGTAIMIECLAIGAAIAGVARWKRKPGSTLVLVGIALCIVVTVGRFPDDGGFGFLVLVCCLLTALTLSMREQQERHQRALLTKARLETQLLKHSIQPHFLMNTLNALVDWVEENPRKGVELIHAIGRHFDLLLRVSGETTIPLGDEIELCESYLAIMSYREEVGFRLEVDGVDRAERLPPCVIHTLAENAITHNRYTEATVFRLHREPMPHGRRYRFETPLSPATPAADKKPRGTGSAYTEARLEEAFSGAWRLEQRAIDGRWVTSIEIQTP